MKKVLLLSIVLVCSLALYSQNDKHFKTGKMVVDIEQQIQKQNDTISQIPIKGNIGVDFDNKTICYRNEDGAKINYLFEPVSFEIENGYSVMQGKALELVSDINLKIKISNHITTNAVVVLLEYDNKEVTYIGSKKFTSKQQ